MFGLMHMYAQQQQGCWVPREGQQVPVRLAHYSHSWRCMCHVNGSACVILHAKNRVVVECLHGRNMQMCIINNILCTIS
jgi:hypothetical protein